MPETKNEVKVVSDKDKEVAKGSTLVGNISIGVFVLASLMFVFFLMHPLPKAWFIHIPDSAFLMPWLHLILLINIIIKVVPTLYFPNQSAKSQCFEHFSLESYQNQDKLD